MRILAPLLVLCVLGLVVVRLAGDPARRAERAWIEASWDAAATKPRVRARLTARLADHLRRYGDDPEARWFACRAWLKVGEAERAIDAVWDDADLASAPGTARRFAALWLRALGFVDDETLRRPRRGGALSALILDEGGDPQARACLDRLVDEHPATGLLESFYGAFLYTTRDVNRHLADRLRMRAEETAHVVAALLSLGPDPYPSRADDLALLEQKLEDDALRRDERIVWSTTCVVLGASEDRRAVDRLESIRRRLSLSTEDLDQKAADIAAAGLLASGRWDMLEALAPYLGDEGPLTLVRAWYAEAVLVRLARGDPEARHALATLWESLRNYPDPPLLDRLATGLLLRDPDPAGMPGLDRVLSDLASPAATPCMHAIQAAWRLRRGDADAREALLRILRALAAANQVVEDPTLANPVLISPVRTVLRALYLYGPDRAP